MSNFTKISYLKGKSKINNFSFERNQYIKRLAAFSIASGGIKVPH